jgi:hypothetical protein
MAQVAITAISLPYRDQTHWIVTALLFASLIAGTMAVYFAATSQRFINSLYRSKDIKLWLADPESLSHRYLHEAGISHTSTMASDLESNILHGDPLLPAHGLSMDHGLHSKRPYMSLQSALLLAAPSSMLNLALGSFVLALGIYLGLIWTENLDSAVKHGTRDARAVFIFFITTSITMLGFHYIPLGRKQSEWRNVQSLRFHQNHHHNNQHCEDSSRKGHLDLQSQEAVESDVHGKRGRQQRREKKGSPYDDIAAEAHLVETAQGIQKTMELMVTLNMQILEELKRYNRRSAVVEGEPRSP